MASSNSRGLIQGFFNWTHGEFSAYHPETHERIYSAAFKLRPTAQTGGSVSACTVDVEITEGNTKTTEVIQCTEHNPTSNKMRNCTFTSRAYGDMLKAIADHIEWVGWDEEKYRISQDRWRL
jgi:hypothetical protein